MFSFNTALMSEVICINGEHINATNLADWAEHKTGIAAEAADFLTEWYAGPQYINLHTSGSTGQPKLIRASKDAMRASAALSCRYFGLTQNSTAFLALPIRYVAGKMMLVRALVSGCRLILAEPDSTPLEHLQEAVDFAPLVPMQVIRTLQQANGAAQLAKIRQLLLGGGFIDSALNEALQEIPCSIYASYGMTETLSHIALRRINGEQRSEWYQPLPGVSLSLTKDETLQISAAHLNIENLETNDIADLRPDGSFRILGRRDAVINSGGIKIQAEKIEQILSAATGLQLAVVPAPDPVLGQCVALLWEGDIAAEALLKEAIGTLPAYHKPRIIRHTQALPRTNSGKLRRKEAAEFISTAPES